MKGPPEQAFQIERAMGLEPTTLSLEKRYDPPAHSRRVPPSRTIERFSGLHRPAGWFPPCSEVFSRLLVDGLVDHPLGLVIHGAFLRR